MLMFLLAIAMLSTMSMASAHDQQVAYGKILVERNCSRCHAVTSTDSSLHKDAPAFRVLSRLYSVETLAEALAEGISTGHPDMPEFVGSPEQVEAIIAYIRSINP